MSGNGKLNTRQERFSRGLAAGQTQRKAYGEAGYKPDDGNASHLTSNHKVTERVTELLDEGAVKARLSPEWVMSRFMRMADSAEQETNRNRALEALAKIQDMFGADLKIEVANDSEMAAKARSLGTAEGEAIAKLLEASSPEVDQGADKP